MVGYYYLAVDVLSGSKCKGKLFKHKLKMNFNTICGAVLYIFGCIIGFGRPSNAEGYRIGVGRADCTGPPVEVVFVSTYSIL